MPHKHYEAFSYLSQPNMASPARKDIEEARNKACQVYSKLPHDIDVFKRCQTDEISIDSVLANLQEKAAAHREQYLGDLQLCNVELLTKHIL